MNNKTYIDMHTCDELASHIIHKTSQKFMPNTLIYVYGVPRGGVSVALMIAAHPLFVATEEVDAADIIVDDIIDSGATKEKYTKAYPNKDFYALIDKTDPNCEYKDSWVVFPWENTHEGEETIEDNITRILQYIGEDPSRGGLIETPRRVVKALAEKCSGYNQNPADILKVFEDGGENYDEMVIVKDIPIYSMCEHHMESIFGTATIAYIPDGKVVGLSKLARLANCFARRLQVQERLTTQIAEALQEHLNPKGVGVIIKARHMCMEARGICQQGHYTITSKLTGVMLEGAPRAEFMALAK